MGHTGCEDALPTHIVNSGSAFTHAVDTASEQSLSSNGNITDIARAGNGIVGFNEVIKLKDLRFSLDKIKSEKIQFNV